MIGGYRSAYFAAYYSAYFASTGGSGGVVPDPGTGVLTAQNQLSGTLSDRTDLVLSGTLTRRLV